MIFHLACQLIEIQTDSQRSRLSDDFREQRIVLTEVAFSSLIPTQEAKDLRPRRRLPIRKTSSSGNYCQLLYSDWVLMRSHQL